MDGGKVKKPPLGGHSPPISTKIFFDVIKILIALRFLRGFALSAAALRAPCAWFRFLVPLAAALRSFLDLLCHLLPLRSSDLPGFFYCFLVCCCRFYALMLAIICLLLPGLPLGLLVPSWGCLLLGCICCPGRISPGGFYSLGASLYTRYNYIAPLYLTRLRIGGIFYNHFS